MGYTISLPLMTKLSQFVHAQMGWHYPPERWGDLEKGIEAAAHDLGFGDTSACIEWLDTVPLTRQQIGLLASHFTVGETYFMREPLSFHAFSTRVLPELIESRRGSHQHLRIWSAGCCTGEEPLSIAMSLVMALPDISDWSVEIIATDINPQFLRCATEGVYGDWSFRSLSPSLRSSFFSKTAHGRYRSNDSVRNLITYSYLNLADDVFPSALNNTSAIDVIFCRNVMIYMEAAQIERLIDRFARSLTEGGWLFVGASETSNVKSPKLKATTLPGITVFRRRTAEPSPAVTDPTHVAPSTRQPSPTDAVLSKPSAVQCETDMVARLSRPEEMIAAGWTEDAFKLLEPAATGKQSSSAYLLLARALGNVGDLPGALTAVDQAISANKLDGHAHYLRAMICQELGGGRAVADSLRRALYLDPDSVMAHIALGHYFRRHGQASAARRHFSAATLLLQRMDPEMVLPDSEGLTAARVLEMTAALAAEEHSHER